MKKAFYFKTKCSNSKLFVGMGFDLEQISVNVITSVVGIILILALIGLAVFPYNVIEGTSKGVNSILTVVCLAVLYGAYRVNKKLTKKTGQKPESNNWSWEEALLTSK